MSDTTKRGYVITAGPHSGKSSTCRFLQALSYQVVPEAGRLFFDEQESRGRESVEARAMDAFRRRIIELDRWLERPSMTVDPEGPVFLDRSLADNIAFCRLDDDATVSDDLVNECRDRYDGVFVLDRLPFESDYARHEDAEGARDQHGLLIETYEQLGYDPVYVPVDPISTRVETILETVQDRTDQSSHTVEADDGDGGGQDR